MNLGPLSEGAVAQRLGECPFKRCDTPSTASRFPSPYGGGKELVFTKHSSFVFKQVIASSKAADIIKPYKGTRKP